MEKARISQRSDKIIQQRFMSLLAPALKFMSRDKSIARDNFCREILAVGPKRGLSQLSWLASSS